MAFDPLIIDGDLLSDPGWKADRGGIGWGGGGGGGDGGGGGVLGVGGLPGFGGMGGFRGYDPVAAAYASLRRRMIGGTRGWQAPRYGAPAVSYAAGRPSQPSARGPNIPPPVQPPQSPEQPPVVPPGYTNLPPGSGGLGFLQPPPGNGGGFLYNSPGNQNYSGMGGSYDTPIPNSELSAYRLAGDYHDINNMLTNPRPADAQTTALRDLMRSMNQQFYGQDRADSNELAASGSFDPSLNAALLQGRRGERALQKNQLVAQAQSGMSQDVLDYLQQLGLQDNSFAHQRDLLSAEQGNPLLQLLGSLGGQVLGSYLPGMGGKKSRGYVSTNAPK